MNQQSKAIQWISTNKLYVEISLVALVAISFMLNYLSVSGGAEALMITMLTLAGFYFISAFFMVEIDRPIIAILLKVFSIASSVCIIGLLFTALHLPGASEQLLIGTISMGVAGLIIAYMMITGQASKFIPLLIRLVILGGISLSTLLTLQSQSVQ